MSPTWSHLDQTKKKKGFIILLSVKFFLQDAAGSPGRPKQLHQYFHDSTQ